MRVYFLLFAVLLSPAPSLAQPTAVPQVVEVTAAGEHEPLMALEYRTRALLSEYPVVLAWSVSSQFEPRDVFDAGGRQTLARIWVDARASSRAVLYLVDDAHERFLVRVVPLDAGYDEIACESIGTIVQSSVEALLAGSSVGVSREAAQAQVAAIEPKALPAPAAEPPKATPRVVSIVPTTRLTPGNRTENPLAVGIDASYRAALPHESAGMVHGPELGVSLGRQGVGLGAAGQLHLGYRLPASWEANDVGVRLTGAGARLAGGLRAGLSPAWALALFGTFGADLLHVTPRGSGSGAQPHGAFNLIQPMLGFALETELKFAEHFAAWLAVGAEGDLMGNRFDVVRNGVSKPTLTPWLLQPVVRLGVRLLP